MGKVDELPCILWRSSAWATASLALESPILFYPGANIDIKYTDTFKMNFGFYVGYNTLVNDLGERNISYSIIFGTNF